MEFLIYFLNFIFGAALGSFVLVIADRYHTGLSFWKGRSFCFTCNTKLRLIDLVPVLSFLTLRGKCRYCGFKIPHQAFWVEMLMGALSVIALIKSGLLYSLDMSPDLAIPLVIYLLYTLVFAAIVLISIYDLRHFIIPDAFLIVLILISASLHFFQGFSVEYLFAAALLCLPFALLFIISKGRWLGFGDVKYMFVIGFLLGPAQGLSAVILAFWIGAALSVTLVLLPKILPRFGLPSGDHRFTMKSEIPFGPFLSFGIILSFIFNVDLFKLQILKTFFF